jgi:hypothetical protein
MSISKCRVINLPKISDNRGNLSILEGGVVPFKIRRVYYIYDVPGGSVRGAHAHKHLEQIIIAINGSFDVFIDDGKKKKKIHLNRAFKGLYLTPLIWRNMKNFSTGAICLVLASRKYSEADYIRNYEDFKKLSKQN